ncbi:histidine kinase [Microbacterium sp. AZCO]|uniref:sensor histidine kinase n=1 Tax=Microbacterium sp. AZCO TaxID=3142976 RepID=UPI0031F397E1
MFRPLTPVQIVVDVVVAGVFAALIAPVEFALGRAADSNALSTTLVTVIFAGALAVRRLSPGLALALAWLGAVVQMGFSRPPGLVDVAIFGVLYATAAYGSRLVFWLGFSSAIVGAAVITFYLVAVMAILSAGQTWQSITYAAAVLVAALFALLLAWTVGALVRTGIRARENRAAQVRAEADTATEQERVRIARDMHDVVAHSLAVVIAQADGARYAAASDPAAATEALGTISSTARSALADVRLLLTQLRHSQGDGPQPTLADLEELYAQVRAAGVDLRVDVDPAPPGEPPAAVQLAIYRVLQEALTNALRHGDGGVVSVRLSWLPDRVDLAVRNGTGMDAAPGAGHGLIGMRERAQLAGGTLLAEAVDGAFLVRATIPVGSPA